MLSDKSIYILIAICLMVIFFFVFSRPMKLLLKIVINSLLGIFAFIGMNFLLTPFGLSVGVNALTVTIVGILGIPGFVSLYISQLML